MIIGWLCGESFFFFFFFSRGFCCSADKPGRGEKSAPEVFSHCVFVMKLGARSVREDSSTFPFSYLQHKESCLKDVRQSKEMACSGLTDYEHPLGMRFLVFFAHQRIQLDSSQGCTSQAGCAYAGVCKLTCSSAVLCLLLWLFTVSVCLGCQGAMCWIRGKLLLDLLKLVCTACSLALAHLNSPFPLCSFQESRDGRVDSWRNFQANTKGKKEKKNRTFLRPPKVKMEQRE